MAEEDIKKKQKEAFAKAIEAAKSKDIITFLERLHESRFLDGAKRTLEVWWGMDREKCHEILSTASDKLYFAIAEGKRIIFYESYFFKIIKSEAVNKIEEDKKFIEYDDEAKYASTESLSDRERSPNEAEEQDQIEKEKKVIQIARSLLPKIGGENVQKVMSYVFDAIEAGAEDITNREISEALGLSESSVRKWKQRGFERLRRSAKEAGFHIKYFGEVESDEEDEELEDQDV